MSGFDSEFRKKFKNTNFTHQSFLNQNIFLSGETLIISNQVTKMGYNIAGRQQVILIEPKTKIADSENNVDKIIMSTDKFGKSVTNFRLNTPGVFSITVMFINKKSGYGEELIKHEINVISPRHFFLSFLATLFCLFVPGLLVNRLASKMNDSHSLLPFNWLEAIYRLCFNRVGEFELTIILGGVGVGFVGLISYFVKEAEVVKLFLIICLYVLLSLVYLKKRATHFSFIITVISAIACVFLIDNFLFKYTDYLTEDFASFKYFFLLAVGFIFPPYMAGPIVGSLSKIGIPPSYSIMAFVISALPIFYLYFKQRLFKQNKIKQKKASLTSSKANKQNE